MNKSKKLTTLAILTALAMILSFVESLVPPIVPIPGIKIGLCNVAILFVLYKLGVKEACLVSIIRVVLVSMLFGNFQSMLFSLAGAALSLTAMALLKKVPRFSLIGVSVAGAVSHNIGQIIMACIIMETNVIIYYLPFLLISGIVTGIVIGIVGALLLNRFDKILFDKTKDAPPKSKTE
ncbi:MAG: Gx transporter family protein [Clostridia bacterium]|nr:Gx transporter family protein [Clostridia bacterium]